MKPWWDLLIFLVFVKRVFQGLFAPKSLLKMRRGVSELCYFLPWGKAQIPFGWKSLSQKSSDMRFGMSLHFPQQIRERASSCQSRTRFLSWLFQPKGIWALLQGTKIIHARRRTRVPFCLRGFGGNSPWKTLFTNTKNIKRSHQGFTLIETIMAMVIMATGILLLVNTWGGSFVRLERTQKSFEMATLLERKMLDYEIKYRGRNTEQIPESEDGDFDGYPNYTWQMTSKKLEFPDIGAALTARDGGVDNMTEMVVKQLTETLSKSIKEVTVSITYSREGKKPVSFSLTTYFVDYDKGGSLGIPGG